MKSFDEIAAKKANGGTLTPLETISLEGPCIDNQKRLNAFNRAIDDADRDIKQLRLIAEAAYKEGLRASIKELSSLDPDNPLTVDQAWKQSTAWQHIQWGK